MKFYDTSKQLYLETNVSGVDLGAGLLQMQEGMNCVHDKVPSKQPSIQLLSPVKVYHQVQSGDTAILKEKHWVYYID